MPSHAIVMELDPHVILVIQQEVEGLGPHGLGMGDCHVVMPSPREVIRLSIKCEIELGGGATRVGAEEIDEEWKMITGRIG